MSITFHGLLGTDGQRHDLAEFAAKRLLVFIFDANRCPTAHAYESRMKELQDEYGDRGVQLILVNSTNSYLYPDESYDAMVARASEREFNFPYLNDEDQSLARAMGATCTFHVFVLDEDRRIRYRGRFDDSRNPARVRSRDLLNAIDDLLAGRDVRVPETEAFGCALDIVGPAMRRPDVATARDPICGMDVPVTADALQTHIGGRTYYFCATVCKETFEAQPLTASAATE